MKRHNFAALTGDEDYTAIIPRSPTEAAPGSQRRMEVYRARLERGEHLHHPADVRRPTVLLNEQEPYDETLWMNTDHEAAFFDLITRKLLPSQLPQLKPRIV